MATPSISRAAGASGIAVAIGLAVAALAPERPTPTPAPSATPSASAFANVGACELDGGAPSGCSGPAPACTSPMCFRVDAATQKPVAIPCIVRFGQVTVTSTTSGDTSHAFWTCS